MPHHVAASPRPASAGACAACRGPAAAPIRVAARSPTGDCCRHRPGRSPRRDTEQRGQRRRTFTVCSSIPAMVAPPPIQPQAQRRNHLHHLVQAVAEVRSVNLTPGLPDLAAQGQFSKVGSEIPPRHSGPTRGRTSTCPAGHPVGQVAVSGLTRITPSGRSSVGRPSSARAALRCGRRTSLRPGFDLFAWGLHHLRYPIVPAEFLHHTGFRGPSPIPAR